MLATLVLLPLAANAASCPDTLKFVKRKLNSSETVNLCSEYQGKTLLIVNTASYCGFTPQFEGLEKLYADYKEKGVVVLGFPSHDFNQEDDDEGKTAELCELTYGVKFPMFEPMAVRGDDADPLYRKLAAQAGEAPKWNFHKYVVNREGKVVASFSAMTKPTSDDLIEALEGAM
ncbi:glutathione peroxidase [Neiella holothuriorum]|uniref:glutathione peroxidase n=1 Tax=Neiella holothuriorum TaxID=2870530 RepID=UPI00298FDB31|nr:glutathione peroxidase [Neiella holothuriorum]